MRGSRPTFAYLMLTVSEASLLLLALDAFLCLWILATGDSSKMAFPGVAAAVGETRRTTPSSDSPLLVLELDVTRNGKVRTAEGTRHIKDPKKFIKIWVECLKNLPFPANFDKLLLVEYRHCQLYSLILKPFECRLPS